MGLFDLTIPYVVIRTALAVLVAVLALRNGRAEVVVAGQGISDLGCALLLVAYVKPGLRSGMGDWTYLVFVYVALWEGVKTFNRLRRLNEVWVDSEDADAGDRPDNLAFVGWAFFFVAPAVMAGLFLVIERMAPGYVTFPPY